MSEYREYKKWLKHTLPKLEEWAESNEDDAGDCPLVQDEACWILGLIKDTESQLAAARQEVKEVLAEREAARSMAEKLGEALKIVMKDIYVIYGTTYCGQHEQAEKALSAYSEWKAGKS